MFARLQIRLRQRACRFSLLEIGLRDGFVLVKVLRALEGFIRKLEGFARFEITGTEQGIIRTGHEQERLAGTHMLAGRDQDAADRSSHLRDHRRGLETIVGDGSRQPESALQRRLGHSENLDMRHLFGGQGE